MTNVLDCIHSVLEKPFQAERKAISLHQELVPMFRCYQRGAVFYVIVPINLHRSAGT